MNFLNNAANALVGGAIICGLWYAYSMAPVDFQNPSVLFGCTMLGCVVFGWLITR